MGCEHKETKATRRIISGGATIVSLQCQNCGSGRAAKMSEYNVSELPDFDPSIAERYREKIKSEWENQNAIFRFEQITKTGEWWARYKAYLETYEWRQVSAFVIRRDKVCQRCFRSVAQQSHHLTYETYNKHGFTFPAECVGVCEDCHEYLHRRDEK